MRPALRQGEHTGRGPLEPSRLVQASHQLLVAVDVQPLAATAARVPRPPDPGPPPAFVRRRGCARQTVARIAAVVSWLRTLPLGDAWGALAERGLGGRC